MNAREAYRSWLENAGKDEALRRELTEIGEKPEEIGDRFYRDLEFGTAGLRGLLGAGTNRMNEYTVARATQGYANYLRKQRKTTSVAIAYDSRRCSDRFARTAAAVFAENGVSVWLYPRLMPTPALSFAVRDLGCGGGVVITASHNPAEYNGYKVYGPDGCQITTGAAEAIQREIGALDCFKDVCRGDFDALLGRGLIRYIGEDTLDRYLAAVSSASVLPKEVSRDVSIVYTPLNGTGISCVPRCLRENGFVNIILAEEQSGPDGDFPTCPYPNPEIREALEVGLRWAERTGSDLLLATDPDCDRVGTAVRSGEGYTLLTGNEMGVLLLDFLCAMRRKAGTLPERPVAVKTIVSTPLAARIAEHYGVELRDVLTGFKYIGEQIGLLEQAGEAERFIFGFEESYGYLSGGFVRDKDAVNASLLICELFAWHRSRGRSLTQALEELYKTYGYYAGKTLSFTFPGEEGLRRMGELTAALRREAPKELGGFRVTGCRDYLPGIDGLPKADVLRYALEGGAEVIVRPSGTEPKLKVYLTAVGKSKADCRSAAERLEKHFTAWAKG